MALPAKVYLREVGPREGFQTLPTVVPTEHKVQLIDMLSDTGVPLIEVTSFVRPDRVPQMADAEEVVKSFSQKPGVQYTALYLNKPGFERAQASGRLRNEGWLYTAASRTFLEKNNNSSFEKVNEGVPGWLELFDAAGVELRGVMISTAFGCNYEGEVPHSRVLTVLRELINRIRERGKKLPEISLADTTGHANPESLRRLVGEVRKTFPESEVSLHLHDTRGTGMANVYAGLLEGVAIFECSVAGMGGCPFAAGAAGNVPTEDVAYLCEELGVRTGVDLSRYVEAAKFAEQITGRILPGKLKCAHNPKHTPGAL